MVLQPTNTLQGAIVHQLIQIKIGTITMMTNVWLKKNDGNLKLISSPFCIGEYVKIYNCGCQYYSYTNAFMYFWGGERPVYLEEKHKHEYWKIINMVMHVDGRDIIYHIRNYKGENAVIAYDGLVEANFHNRNRINARSIVIYQLPIFGNVMPHKWTDKLWDFYDGKKLIKNERKLSK